MKLFPVRGGIHPEYHKELASDQAITALPMPLRLEILLQQHIGAPARVTVAAGFSSAAVVSTHTGAATGTGFVDGPRGDAQVTKHEGHGGALDPPTQRQPGLDQHHRLA
jgi:hypothetical protein